jgi:hypothetical protein
LIVRSREGISQGLKPAFVAWLIAKAKALAYLEAKANLEASANLESTADLEAKANAPIMTCFGRDGFFDSHRERENDYVDVCDTAVLGAGEVIAFGESSFD